MLAGLNIELEAQAAKYCDYITKHSPAGCTSLQPSVSLSLHLSMQKTTALQIQSNLNIYKNQWMPSLCCCERQCYHRVTLGLIVSAASGMAP